MRQASRPTPRDGRSLLRLLRRDGRHGLRMAMAGWWPDIRLFAASAIIQREFGQPRGRALLRVLARARTDLRREVPNAVLGAGPSRPVLGTR